MVLLYVLALFAVFFLLVFLELILFGSKVDPDDNGLVRTPYQRSRYKLKKLRQRERK